MAASIAVRAALAPATVVTSRAFTARVVESAFAIVNEVFSPEKAPLWNCCAVNVPSNSFLLPNFVLLAMPSMLEANFVTSA